MNITPFDEQNTVFAKNQPQYRQLHAYRFGDRCGRVACCWSLSWRERLAILFTGRIWHQILTFDEPLQPQLMSVEKPEMPTVKAAA